MQIIDSIVYVFNNFIRVSTYKKLFLKNVLFYLRSIFNHSAV
jgi:hypothetical protein